MQPYERTVSAKLVHNMVQSREVWLQGAQVFQHGRHSGPQLPRGACQNGVDVGREDIREDGKAAIRGLNLASGSCEQRS